MNCYVVKGVEDEDPAVTGGPAKMAEVSLFLNTGRTCCSNNIDCGPPAVFITSIKFPLLFLQRPQGSTGRRAACSLAHGRVELLFVFRRVHHLELTWKLRDTDRIIWTS
ncbi:hypothetical protein RRG08_048764 [Elysia crispata]|uniref:Uncharacterized protein n=1 Tax=Elysia crispata TaxID=231223 RepID=A0AAE1AMX7_9GAST|nr:hypothetical protein RRG08_048764 [Elysia crispata]